MGSSARSSCFLISLFSPRHSPVTLLFVQLGSGQQEEDSHKGTIRHRLAQPLVLSCRYSADICSPISSQLFAEGLTWEGSDVSVRFSGQEVGPSGCDTRALQLGSAQERSLQRG